MNRKIANSGTREERISQSPQWADGEFRNPSGAGRDHFARAEGSVISDFLFSGKQRRPPRPLPTLDPRNDWAKPPGSGFRTTWLGHSTLFVELDGATFVTDPVWADRASSVGFVGPKRFQPVPVSIDLLPPLDFVLLSHDHYDHLDRGAVEFFAKQGVPLITTLGIGKHLERWGIPSDLITELDWWDHAELCGVRVTSAPTQHFSGRSLINRNTTLWGSFVVEGENHRFYFGADSGYGGHFKQIAREFGRFDLVTLEIGAFHPSWAGIHLGPENALKAHTDLGGGPFLPIHWGTFDLAVHAWDEPPEKLVELGAGRRLLLPQIGQGVEPSTWETNTLWWRA